MRTGDGDEDAGGLAGTGEETHPRNVPRRVGLAAAPSRAHAGEMPVLLLADLAWLSLFFLGFGFFGQLAVDLLRALHGRVLALRVALARARRDKQRQLHARLDALDAAPAGE